MLFDSYEAFTTLSPFLALFFLVLGVMSYTFHCTARNGSMAIARVNLGLQIIVGILSVLWMIELLVGVYRTIQVSGPNSHVLPNEPIGFAIFAIVYFSPIVFELYAIHILQWAMNNAWRPSV